MRLSAPDGYYDLTPAAKAELTNGCGPAGWRGKLIPDNLLAEDISEACDIHDFAYGIGGTEEDRKAADRQFLNNMLDLIEAGTHDHVLLGARRHLAMEYYEKVRDHGHTYFSFQEKEEPAHAI